MPPNLLQIWRRNLDTYEASDSEIDDLPYYVGDQHFHGDKSGFFSPAFQKSTHLHAFSPYFEKAASTHSVESIAPRQGHAIHIGTIRGWIELCNEHHGSHCQKRGVEKGAGRPEYLIDVGRKCLVRAEDHPYVALSYVWGQAKSMETTKANVNHLLEEDSFAGDDVELLATIRDAMNLTAILGEAFLWVDRLCIVQDCEREEMSQQISVMGDIYANSRLAIIAANGSGAVSPLLGKSHITTPRSNEEKPEALCIQRDGLSPCSAAPKNLSDKQHYLKRHDKIMHFQLLEFLSSRWSCRAWTYQEYLLAPRRLVFHSNTVNWDCHCASFHEGQQHITAVQCGKPTPDRLTLNGAPWPDFYRYARLISLFNTRDLTFPEDVLDACESVLWSLSYAFPGGFISGLPVAFFDAALLWQPYDRSRRRRASCKQGKQKEVRDETKRKDEEEGKEEESRNDEREKRAVLPSWSWIGFEGHIHSELWVAGCNYLINKRDVPEDLAFDVVGTVLWRHASSTAGPWRRVSLPRNDRDARERELQALPDGWSGSNRETGRISFAHRCDPDRRFSYPIPISAEGYRPPKPLRSAFLKCETFQGFLKLGQTGRKRHWLFQISSPYAAVVGLEDDNGNEVGFLVLHGGLEGDGDFVQLVEGEICELVELSISMPRQPDGRARESVNIMWVGWEDGVAYRKAIGMVDRDAWHLAKNAPLELILS